MGRKAVETDDLVFLDASHYIFHRYYAIMRWCKIADKEFDDEDAMIAHFAKLFESQLEAMKKKLKFAWHNLYIVQDCPREKIWRKSLFPEYKENRPGKEETGFNPRVFVESYATIIPNMQDRLGVHLLQHPTAEADDIIATIHKEIRRTSPSQQVIIITNDNDYLQLKDVHTMIYNSNLKEISERYDEETLRVFGLWKAIRGDDSDNIPSIDKKIGDKVALKLAQDPDLLTERLSKPGVAERFRLNKTLIMFESIPDKITQEIVKSWKALPRKHANPVSNISNNKTKKLKEVASVNTDGQSRITGFFRSTP